MIKSAFFIAKKGGRRNVYTKSLENMNTKIVGLDFKDRKVRRI